MILSGSAVPPNVLSAFPSTRPEVPAIRVCAKRLRLIDWLFILGLREYDPADAGNQFNSRQPGTIIAFFSVE